MWAGWFCMWQSSWMSLNPDCTTHTYAIISKCTITAVQNMMHCDFAYGTHTCIQHDELKFVRSGVMIRAPSYSSKVQCEFSSLSISLFLAGAFLCLSSLETLSEEESGMRIEGERKRERGRIRFTSVTPNKHHVYISGSWEIGLIFLVHSIQLKLNFIRLLYTGKSSELNWSQWPPMVKVT